MGGAYRRAHGKSDIEGAKTIENVKKELCFLFKKYIYLKKIMDIEKKKNTAEVALYSLGFSHIVRGNMNEWCVSLPKSKAGAFFEDFQKTVFSIPASERTRIRGRLNAIGGDNVEFSVELLAETNEIGETKEAEAFGNFCGIFLSAVSIVILTLAVWAIIWILTH